MIARRATSTAAVCICLLVAAVVGSQIKAEQWAPGSTRVTAAHSRDNVSSVHFTASGDFSSSPQAVSVLEQVGDIDPDLHLALGDLSYGAAGSEQAWCDLVTSRAGVDLPFQLISGNHESDGKSGHIDRFADCLPNRLPGMVGQYGRQYYVDVPRDGPLARFIMISPALTFDDGAWSYEKGSPRYRWTENAIDTARDSGVPWVVVGMHKPCLSVGRYSCEPGADLLNLLLKKRVDLVLSGHEHIYARFRQLALSTSCISFLLEDYAPHCVSDDDGDMRKRAGTVLAIVGTGGAPLREVNPRDTEASYVATWSGLNSQPAWGNLDVVVNDESLKARFRPVPGSDFTDSFTITDAARSPRSRRSARHGVCAQQQ